MSSLPFRSFLLSLAALALLASCMDRDPKPKDLIPVKQMQAILIDMHYADAYAYQEYRSDSIYRAAAGMYLDIFRKYNVDTGRFNRSFNYYVQHPRVLDRMYAAMIDTLNAREGRLRTE